jgi:hypothetical protein
MSENNISYITNFAEFEILSFSEPLFNYTLFQDELIDKQIEQIKVINNLESQLPIFNGSSFANQVHFQTAYQIPVQRWYPYREGYSKQLVDSFIKELNITGNVFDPFSGSGTTLLSARNNNLLSYGMDVNPISVLISTVENDNYLNTDLDFYVKEIEKFQNSSRSNEYFSTRFPLAEKIFNPEILQSLLQIKNQINSINSPKIRNIFFLAWLSMVEEVSNIKKEGNGIKYKNRKRTADGYINIDKKIWENMVYPDDKFAFVKTKFLQRIDIILKDIRFLYGNNSRKPVVLNESCLEFDKFIKDDIQFTFFSPPYCNCFDYFEIHKVELWLGDFVTTQEDFRLLRSTGFRSNTNSINHKPIIYQNINVENLIALFNTNRLWNTRIPSVIRGYFDDSHTLLNKLFQQSEKGGYVGIVIGNSAYSGIIIPSDLIIADIAREVGFTVKNVFVARHLTTSSQQKQELKILKNHLRESIVLLQK